MTRGIYQMGSLNWRSSLTFICENACYDLFALLLALEIRQNKWQNQRTEAYNTVIKEEIFRQKTDQVRIHDLIEKRVVQSYLDELVKAIYSDGRISSVRRL